MAYANEVRAQLERIRAEASAPRTPSYWRTRLLQAIEPAEHALGAVPMSVYAAATSPVALRVPGAGLVWTPGDVNPCEAWEEDPALGSKAQFRTHCMGWLADLQAAMAQVTSVVAQYNGATGGLAGHLEVLRGIQDQRLTVIETLPGEAPPDEKRSWWDNLPKEVKALVIVSGSLFGIWLVGIAATPLLTAAATAKQLTSREVA